MALRFPLTSLVFASWRESRHVPSSVPGSFLTAAQGAGEGSRGDWGAFREEARGVEVGWAAAHGPSPARPDQTAFEGSLACLPT